MYDVRHLASLLARIPRVECLPIVEMPSFGW